MGRNHRRNHNVEPLPTFRHPSEEREELLDLHFDHEIYRGPPDRNETYEVVLAILVTFATVLAVLVVATHL